MESTTDRNPMQKCSLARMHGLMGKQAWAPPEMVTEYDVEARLSFTDIKAHEYTDVPTVLREKVKLLAGLVKRSKNLLAYTGAGISTAAGIDDYATKGREKSVVAEARPVVKDWKQARPTQGHRVMVALYEAGFLKHWVQQNHDSLPQKAGYPQFALNEIHGSLHDPANPIVPYEGTLRDDLHEWLREWQARADLCLALGTSMSGFNADSVPYSVAKRYSEGKGMGTVIINLQQTSMDEICSLRIYAKLDDVLSLLAEELGITKLVKPLDTPLYTPNLPKECVLAEDVFRIPFDASGKLLSSLARLQTSKWQVWDLRVGQKVRLTGGPYQGDIGRVVERNEAGHYRLKFENSINHTLNMKRAPFSLWLGCWWLDMVTQGRGIVPNGPIPFLNVPAEAAEAEAKAQAPNSPPAKMPSKAFNMSRYQTMLRIGLAPAVVLQKMDLDGIPAAEAKQWLDQQVKTQTSQSAEPDTQTVTNK